MYYNIVTRLVRLYTPILIIVIVDGLVSAWPDIRFTSGTPVPSTRRPYEREHRYKRE